MMTLLLQIVLLAGPVLATAAVGAEVDEYRVKALFLYNFTQFVEWPVEAFKDANDPLTICIFGPSPFEKGELEKVLAGKHIDTHPLGLRQINDAAQSPGCQIVFVGAPSSKRARTLLADHKLAGLLIVGETAGFAASGGVINFLIRDGRVRIEINVSAAEREKLHVSAKLLKLAEIVR